VNALRQKLPNRRHGVVVEVDCDGVRYRAQFLYFADGTLAEIFLNGGKVGSATSVASHDAAVAASLALQHGCPVEILSRALLKLPSGESAGPLGRALDLASEWRK
jgi:hypothetical protein